MFSVKIRVWNLILQARTTDSNMVGRLELTYSNQGRQANRPYTTYCYYASSNTDMWSIDIQSLNDVELE